MLIEFGSYRPELHITQSDEVWIKPHNNEQRDLLVQNCPKCPLRETICRGTINGSDTRLIKISPTQREVKDFLKKAPCKPRAHKSQIQNLESGLFEFISKVGHKIIPY